MYLVCCLNHFVAFQFCLLRHSDCSTKTNIINESYLDSSFCVHSDRGKTRERGGRKEETEREGEKGRGGRERMHVGAKNREREREREGERERERER